MRGPPRAKEGYIVGTCSGCGANPIRDDGSERRGQYNWMLTCSHCNGRRCLVCLPTDRTICNLCVKEAAA